jgi:hypothetical protein
VGQISVGGLGQNYGGSKLRPVSQPRHFAVKIAVRVGYGPIAPKAEPIEETKETGINPRWN